MAAIPDSRTVEFLMKLPEEGKGQSNEHSISKNLCIAMHRLWLPHLR